MRILHLIPSLAARTGGPVEALAGWCDGLLALGADVTVGALLSEDEGPRVAFAPDVKLVLAPRDIAHLYYGHGLAGLLKQEPFDLVHSHGLWTYVNYLASRLARSRGVPHVISPCGMLAAKALSRSDLRKRVALATFQRRALAEAATVVANAAPEAEDIHRTVPEAMVAIVPNPIRPRSSNTDGAPSPALRAILALPPEAKIILFLGRLHVVKGVDRLLEAWRRLHDHHNDWHLVLAGPDQGGFAQKVAGLDYATRARLHLPGQVSPAAKWAILERATLFVMPSDHENFGVAIAEALSAGVPTVTTRATPWQVLAEKGAGWWIAPDTEALQLTLDAAMREAPDVRISRAVAARAIAAEFEVRRVGERLLHVYEACLAG